MPGSNDFLPFATDPSAVVLSQAAYAAASPAVGQGEGIFPQDKFNKIARQGAVMAYAIGELVRQAGLNALDDGNLPALVASVKSALAQLTTWATITGTAPPVSTFPNDANYIINGGVGTGFMDASNTGGYGGVGAVVSGSLFLNPQPGSWQILNLINSSGLVWYWLKRVA